MISQWSKAGEIQHMLRTVARVEREWLGRVPEAPGCTPWMPASPAEFIMLLTAAVSGAPGGRFLEIGAGPGTKMLIAAKMFELDVHGIEKTPAYVAQALQLGMPVELADASTWDGYGKFDIVYFNRPLRDRDPQRALEARVWDEMTPGAVVIALNLEGPPPITWHVIDEELGGPVKGVWAKP